MNPSAARRILPWTLGFGRIASLFPEQLQRNQNAIMALLEREIRAAVECGSGHSPDPVGDAEIIFAFTAHTTHHCLLNGIAPDERHDPKAGRLRPARPPVGAPGLSPRGRGPRRTQTSSDRPMISFMISVVPP